MRSMHMKIFSASLAVREVQIKTTVRYHYPPTGMAKIKNSDTTKCWWGFRETGSYMADGNIKWCSHSGKQFGSFLKKTKHAG